MLDDQTLEEGSDELKQLRRHRKDVEGLLREKYEYEPSIWYGGSYKKGTINRDWWLPPVHICHPYPLVRFAVITQSRSRMR